MSRWLAERRPRAALRGERPVRESSAFRSSIAESQPNLLVPVTVPGDGERVVGCNGRQSRNGLMPPTGRTSADRPTQLRPRVMRVVAKAVDSNVFMAVSLVARAPENLEG